MSASHGNTPAAWTAVTIILLGFVLGGLALVIGNMPLFWIGCALGPIGGLAGLVMSKMGLGAEPVSR
ncbi:MAG TPA: HGxxPAAW family protein [Nocardioidaceae bacterium]|nr:HGxxPAAW family protein [Nocardioidaceae bacterium]